MTGNKDINYLTMLPGSSCRWGAKLKPGELPVINWHHARRPLASKNDINPTTVSRKETLLSLYQMQYGKGAVWSWEMVGSAPSQGWDVRRSSITCWAFAWNLNLRKITTMLHVLCFMGAMVLCRDSKPQMLYLQIADLTDTSFLGMKV